jgi:hypothetical protein
MDPHGLPGSGGVALMRFGMGAIVAAGFERDRRLWVHLSVSRQAMLPTWKDLTLARDEILGPEVKCIIVVAPESEHVNIHPFCMHLWHCVEDILPGFRRNGQI